VHPWRLHIENLPATSSRDRRRARAGHQPLTGGEPTTGAALRRAGTGRRTASAQPGDQQDILVRLLTERLSTRAEVRTVTFERDVACPSGVRVDLLWTFADASDRLQRVAFLTSECSVPLNPVRLQAFRRAVESLPGAPTTGVWVLSSHQPGTRPVRDTHGVVVVELGTGSRRRDRIHLPRVEITVAMVQPIMEELRVETVERFVGDATLSTLDRRQQLLIGPVGGAPDSYRPLEHVLAEGELGSFGEPRAVHPVRREFAVRQVLVRGNRRLAVLQAASACVGAVERPPVTVHVGSVRTLGWMLSVSLSAARVWGAHKGRSWTTAPTPESAPA
jgi:hypothetical protein